MIHKLAGPKDPEQKRDDSVAGGPKNPEPKKTPTSTTGGLIYSAALKANVIRMQEQIIRLSQLLAPTINMPSTTSKELKERREAFLPTTSVDKFLIYSEVGPQGIPALPMTKEPGRGKESPEHTDFFFRIHDTLKRVGSPTSESAITKPDGVWGNRTQTALRAVSQLAPAIVSLAGKLNFTAKFDLQGFSQIPGENNPAIEHKDKEDLNNRAVILTQTLSNFNDNYDNLVKYMQKQFPEYMDVNQTFRVPGPGSSENLQRLKLTPEEHDEYSSLKDYEFNIKYANETYKIKMSDFDSFNSLLTAISSKHDQQWLINNFKAFTQAAKLQINDQIKDYINKSKIKENTQAVTEKMVISYRSKINKIIQDANTYLSYWKTQSNSNTKTNNINRLEELLNQGQVIQKDIGRYNLEELKEYADPASLTLDKAKPRE